MRVKKQIYEALVRRVKDEILELQGKRIRNRYAIKKLAKEQREIQKQQTEMVNVIRELEGK